eukprot:gnl/TRDRNA2_/TRDRNA2_126118_c0_seq1.p1 gnl/TRDRNA2_/TRDRNA2_126118_c0~~gnl/TRDRNA2_/TRDRNA2_126118_c0_seq1.p1  ORF type:complete len:701 (-),score=106.11 gnl/TRDRNA2_/TRDRNA2_126118_c0_seq1:95-2197(-)
MAASRQTGAKHCRQRHCEAKGRCCDEDEESSESDNLEDANGQRCKPKPGAVAKACYRKKWHLVRSLLKESAEVQGPEGSLRGSALHWAALHGNKDIVALLLDRSANLDAMLPFASEAKASKNVAAKTKGIQPVHMAVRGGHLAVLDELWHRDCTVMCRRDGDGAMPIHYAAQKGNVHILEWLYLRGVPINSADALGLSPLHCAVHEDRILAAQHLIRCGVAVSTGDMEGRTPLHFAAMKGRLRLLNGALQLGPLALGDGRVYAAQDSDGNTPWDLAAVMDPCMSWKLAVAQADLDPPVTSTSVGSKLLCGFLRRSAAACHPGRLSCTCAVPLLHISNALGLIFVALPGLAGASRLTSGIAMLALLQLICQGLSLWHFVRASSMDPGYCDPARRHAAGNDMGPDGNERLVQAVQSELNESLRCESDLLAGRGPCTSSTADTAAAGETDKPEPTIEEVKASVAAGKQRLADMLQVAGAARRACYPGNYVELALSKKRSANPWQCGDGICSVCGRLRTRRSKHCKECARCVARFDHHCPWLGNCVGANNILDFVRFVFWTFTGLVLAQMVVWDCLNAIAPRGVIPAMMKMSSLTVLCPFLLLLANFGLNCCWIVFTGILLISQIVIAAVDATQYELDQSSDPGFCKRLCNSSCYGILKNIHRILLRDLDLSWEEEGKKSAPQDVELGVRRGSGRIEQFLAMET